MSDKMRELTAGTLSLLRGANGVEPNANRAIADFLAGREDVELAVVLLAAHGDCSGLVLGATSSGILGLGRHADFDTIYIYMETAAQASLMQAELRQLFYEHGLHGYIGPAMRFSEVATAVEAAAGERPRHKEAVFARWGYEHACEKETFAE